MSHQFQIEQAVTCWKRFHHQHQMFIKSNKFQLRQAALFWKSDIQQCKLQIERMEVAANHNIQSLIKRGVKTFVQIRDR